VEDSDDEDAKASNSFTPGTTITINTATGSVRMTSSGSGSYGTTVINEEDIGKVLKRRDSTSE